MTELIGENEKVAKGNGSDAFKKERGCEILI